MEEPFEEIEHTADIAIRVWGADLAELFHNAALGMVSQLTDVETVRIETTVTIELRAADVETLLIEWLGELLYLGEKRDVVFTQFDVLELEHNALRAVARGGPVPRLDHHIKAVTFSELDVRRVGSGYGTTVVFDV